MGSCKVSVPEGLYDGIQAVYCLEWCKKAARPERDGIWFDKRATTRAMTQDRIRDNRARSIFATLHPRLGHACVTY